MVVVVVVCETELWSTGSMAVPQNEVHVSQWK